MRWVSAAAVAVLALLASAYVSPVTGLPEIGRVLRPADIPAQNWERGHRGVDLAIRPGEQVLAPAAGEVAFVGVVVGTPVISVVHPDGIRTTYQPVHPWVEEGEAVTAGQPLGLMAGSEGLHWGALTGPDVYINPLSLLPRPVIRLKPVDGRG